MRDAMNPLNLVPSWAWLALLVAALGVGCMEKSRHAQTRAEFAEARAEAAAATARYEAAQRTEESRRAAAVTEARNEATKELERARADGAAADAAGGRLRSALDIAARALASCGDPRVADGSAPAPATGRVLADVQRRIDEAAGILAAHADRSRVAGQACERSYDSLTPP